MSNTKIQKQNALPPLEEGDYYLENGLLVFTAQYHLKRGYCCGNGCRHCPYRVKQQKAQSREQGA